MKHILYPNKSCWKEIFSSIQRRQLCYLFIRHVTMYSLFMITNDWLLVTYSQNDIGKSKVRSAIVARRESYKYF